MNDNELNLEELENVTGGMNYVSEVEELELYRNFAPERAEQIIALKNQKAAAEEVAKTLMEDNLEEVNEVKRNLI